MDRIIGGIYEIKEQIGAGGGSIVYIGWHINLRKTVVLKADRRSLTVGKEVLRREVDMLKGLTNTYIPQVYDFIEEAGTVYTVMDYIEGKSFEELIDANEKFKQKDIVRWACQILSALNYLHSQPPYGILHGDIKPANIMLRENGDICLIDYNIALALGEDGAVQVGYSRGYASPEHYGISYLEDEKTEGFKIENTVIAESETVLDTESDTKKGSRISGRRKERIKLDVRSDIYSLGATLYHMISGERPAMEAPKVVKLEKDICSPALSNIIAKAMHPVAGKRYQSAAEMLQALQNLYNDDERTVHYRINRRIAYGGAILVLLFGVCSSFLGMKRQEIRQEKLTIAEYAENALEKGDVKNALKLSMESLDEGNGILSVSAGAMGQKALTDALGVYNLAASFEADRLIELPNSLIKIVESPNKDLMAFIYHNGAVVYNVGTKEGITELKLVDSANADVCFLDDNRVIYAGEKGVTLYNIETQNEVWTGDRASDITISQDGRIAVSADGADGDIQVYDVVQGRLIKSISLNERQRNLPVNNVFADNKSSIFELNSDGSLLAVSFADGSLRLYPINSENASNEDIILIDPSEYNTFTGGFTGLYFSFTASKEGNTVVAVIDTDDMEQEVAYETDKQVWLKTEDEKIFLSDGHIIEQIDPDKQEENQILYLPEYNIEDFEVGERWILVSTDDSAAYVYSKSGKKAYEVTGEKTFSTVKLQEPLIFVGNRDDNYIRALKYDNRDDMVFMTYDPDYAHDEARISIDGDRLVLFSINGIKVLDKEGKLIGDAEFPDKDNIYDQQFRCEGDTTDILHKNLSGDIVTHVGSEDTADTTEGSWLEVTWYDGMIRKYSDIDGHLISEEKVDMPSKELYEEFHTTDYKVVSSLHSSPEIYDKDGGKLLKLMDNQDYLTYVTQIDDMLLLEYVRASVSGDTVQIGNKRDINGMKGVGRYGVLLDHDLNTIAELPGLCDHHGSILYFDDALGIIRKTEIISLQKLEEMAIQSLED